MADIPLLQTAGAQPVKPTKFAPFGTKRLFTGLYTYRSPLIQPGTRAEERFYGGRPDALIDGLNVEISNKNTLIRRPGYSAYTTATLPTAATSFYSFQQLNTNVTVLADTASGVYSLSPTSTTELFAKSTGAVQTTFQGVGSWMFMGDGVDLKKWNGTTVSTWGIAPPATAATLSFSAGTLNTTSTLGWSYVYCYQNATTQHISTASPVSAYSGKQTNIQVTVQGVGSADPQVGNIQIYRTNDGGATYYLLGTVPNTSTWTYVDTSADSALNTFIVAPQALANNPPPAGLTNLAFFSGRLWGSVANYVYYAAGPDTTNGSGNESFPPLNYFQFPSVVTRLVPYTNGLFVFTVDNIYVIQGNVSAAGASTAGGTVFYSLLFQSGMGVRSYNAVDTYAGVIYAFTSDNQLIAINPGSGVQCLSAGITDQLAAVNPANVSIAFLTQGFQDQALFLCDGAGSIWRCNPNQQPEGLVCWSPKATVTGGASYLSAVETSVGVHQLMVASGSSVLVRNWAVYTDNGSAYTGYATFGSIVLTQPGQLAEVQSICTEFRAVGSQPSLAILPNEISGSFTSLPQSQPDPPQLSPSQSIYSNRYYLSQCTFPTVMRHLQMKVSFATENSASEMLGYSIYGAIHGD